MTLPPSADCASKVVMASRNAKGVFMCCTELGSAYNSRSDARSGRIGGNSDISITSQFHAGFAVIPW
jgi:hypothetical protein